MGDAPDELALVTAECDRLRWRLETAVHRVKNGRRERNVLRTRLDLAERALDVAERAIRDQRIELDSLRNRLRETRGRDA